MRATLALVALAAALATGCGPSAADIAAVTALTGNPTNGATIYEANCTKCHGTDGISGTEKKNIPNAVRRELDKAVSIILGGEDDMDAFADVLTTQEVADVVAYVEAL